MTKTHKIIILAAAVLIIISVLFPPYYWFVTKGEATILFASGWTFITKITKIETKPSIVLYKKIRFDVLSLEIFGVLVMAGAAFLIAKKSK